MRVTDLAKTANIERSFSAGGSFQTLKGAVAYIHFEKPYVRGAHVRVERLLLEEGGKKALEEHLRRVLTSDELRSVYQSILSAWPADELWSCILRRKEQGSLSDLFDVENLDWIK
jgi:hypothetical protein